MESEVRQELKQNLQGDDVGFSLCPWLFLSFFVFYTDSGYARNAVLCSVLLSICTCNWESVAVCFGGTTCPIPILMNFMIGL